MKSNTGMVLECLDFVISNTKSKDLVTKLEAIKRLIELDSGAGEQDIVYADRCPACKKVKVVDNDDAGYHVKCECNYIHPVLGHDLDAVLELWNMRVDTGRSLLAREDKKQWHG